jgi:hypothetical protein
MKATMFGNLAWARATKGEIRGRALAEQLWLLAKAQLIARWHRFGVKRQRDVVTALETRPFPQTPLVADCLTLIETLGPDFLVGHAMRTVALGALFGVRDGLSWDHEVFVTAALLHDLGLAQRDHRLACFAHDGAEQALAFLEQRGVPPSRRMQVADAICLHLRIEVPVSCGVEAHLVHVGAGADVFGRGLRGLPAAHVRDVFAAHPRGNWAHSLCRLLDEEARRHPASRIGRWMSLGFQKRILSHPADHEAAPT